MREKLMTLTLTELRNIAKTLNLSGISTLKKTELVDLLVEIDEKNRANEAKSAAAAETNSAPSYAGEMNKSHSRKKKRGNEDAGNTEKTPDAADEPELSENESASEKAEKTPSPVNELESGEIGGGVLEITYGEKTNGYLRGDSYFQNDRGDIYVAQSQINRFSLKTGDYVTGHLRIQTEMDKRGPSLLFVNTINGIPADSFQRPTPFENLTPTFPHEKLRLETPRCDVSVRIIDLLSPIGKGQRGMIVAQPKVGKTTLLKQIAKSLIANHPELHVIILLIDERPEEVTDMKDTFADTDAEIVYSTFDEDPNHHRKVAELVIERAKRLVEIKTDVVILLDSITRLTRAYNLTCTPSGRTILATALQETGSRLDDMVYEEFKGTGNMELVLNRKLSERRIFPAIDILKSSTRRDDLLLSLPEQEAAALIRKVTTTGPRPEFAIEQVLDLFASTKNNAEFMSRLGYQFLDK